MSALGKLKKSTPRSLRTMGKDDMEELRTNALVEIAKKLDKLDSVDSEIKSMSQRLGAIEGLVNDTKDEVRVVKEDIKDVKDEAANMKADIDDLKQRMSDAENAVDQIKALKDLQQEMDKKLDFLSKTVTYHQGMLESTDAKFRATHVIIYGVPEDETFGETDKDRVENIIGKTNALPGVSLGNLKIKRLGDQPLQLPRTRALHVTFDNHDQQRKVLENSKNLKDVTGYKKIYIKKDKHPTVRFEQNRLRKREKEEKEKPENALCKITYDYKERVLKKDGVIIDRFCPSFR